MAELNEAQKTPDDKNDFTRGSIPKKLLLFMLPVFGALVLQAMYGAVDLLVVGQFGSKEGLSGVSTGSQVLNLVTFVVSGLAMGVTIQIGHFMGQKRTDRIGQLIGGAIATFLVISVILCAIMVPFAGGIAELMQAPAEAVDETISYIRICGAGIFFIVAYNVIAAIFRGLGDSKTPLIFVAVACVVNVFGDLLFVAVFKWNVAGAALATVMAQAVSVIFSLVVMKKKDLPFNLKRQDIGFNSEARKFLNIGAPLALQELLTQISFIMLCAFVNALGLTASSGYGVASKLISFIMLIPSSLMQSMASFVSQNVSAGREDRARRAMGTGMAFGTCVGVVIVLFIWTRGYLAAQLFTRDTDVVMAGWEYLKGFAPEAIVTAFLFSFNGYFNGHDKTLFIMISGILQTFCVRLPFAYYQSIQPEASLTKIGAAAPLATVFGILLCVIYYVHITRKKQDTPSL
jgi:putative MATE family efflux protein